MNVTVKDLLNLQEFNSFALLAGRGGMDNIVTSATVMDTPDVHLWLKGGEILLTSGYIFQNDFQKLKEFIINISKVHVSALFIDIDLYIKDFPKDLLALADKLNLPVVYMPKQIAFRDVINTILLSIADERTRYLLLCAQMREQFTEVILHGGSEQEIIEILGKILAQPVAYKDEYFHKTYYTKNAQNTIKTIDNMSIKAIQAKYATIDIQNSGTVYGHIVLSKDINDSKNADKDYCQAAIDNASTTLLLAIQKKISNINIYYRYINEFVISLIMSQYGSLEDINHVAKLFHWKYENGVIVILVEMPNMKLGNNYLSSMQFSTRKDMYTYDFMLKKIKSFFINYFPSVCTAYLNDTLIFMCQTDDNIINTVQIDKDIKAIVAKTAEFLDEKKIKYMIGVGNYQAKLKDANISYAQAKQAIHLGKVLGSEQIIFYDTTGIYKLLEEIYPTDTAKEFCQNTLGELLSEDKTMSNLLDTLLQIESNDWNLKITAEKMFVHYNTIKYRYKNIEELLNMDLSKQHNKFKLTMAIVLFKLRKHLYI